MFRDCDFTNNRIIYRRRDQSDRVTAGVFVITRFLVVFEGTIHFENNAFTAVLVNAGQIVIEPNSRLTFTNNRGLRGGAISMYSFSSVLVSDNCTLEFFNNTATEYGGAIYKHTVEMRDFFATRSCFLEYNGKREVPVSERNISFVFAGNAAPISGSSIFASSFYSCYYSNRGSLDGHSVADFLDDIGNFTFDTFNRTCDCRASALGTTGAKFINDEGLNILSLIPGMRAFLPLTVADELEQENKTEFFTRIVQRNSTININSPYTVNNSVTVYGFPNETAVLIVTTKDAYRILEYKLDVKLLSCPPGYYFDSSDSSKLSCRCSSTEREQAFLGITKCNLENFTAIIQSGYWAGYYDDSDTLYIAVCPFEYCDVSTEYGEEYSLPNSSEALSSFICISGRKGVLCGECDEGQSMYYHSRQLTCGSDDKCSYGIMLYIVSELIPVVIFFTLVILFDISFTTGAKNGFIFFSQMVIILPLNFKKYGLESAQHFQSGYNLFYRIFNIDFFSVESLSFCLFKGATVMDVLAFRYITILFALILIIVVVVCMKYCTCGSKRCSAVKKKVTATTSVLHGLSAFIVICYAKSIRISFFILRQTTLQGAGGARGPSVAFYSGIDYLKEKHIPYAIPAIVSLGTIAVLPPVLLLFYPSILKVFSLCRLSEHRLVTATLRVTRINSLMPMFDVFQGCFKDNFRFFAGLYFFYRIAILVPFAFSESLFQFAIFAELVFLSILGAHSIVHPYKLRTHNVIDSLLFLDLAVINMLTIALLKLSPGGMHLIPLIIYTQILLIYTPMVVLLVFSAVKLVRIVRSFLSKKVEDESEQEFLEHLDDIDRSLDEDMEIRDLHLHSDYQQCDSSDNKKLLNKEST